MPRLARRQVNRESSQNLSKSSAQPSVSLLYYVAMKRRMLLLPVVFLAVLAAAQTVAENAKPATTAPANSAAAPDPLLDARALMNKRQYAEAAAAFQAILAKSPNS